MAYPELGENHQIFGTEYCSGFKDISGNWNNGFYCPKQLGSSSSAVACCGTYIYKYCCIEPSNATFDTTTTEKYQVLAFSNSENLFDYQFLVTIVTAFLLLFLFVVILWVYYYNHTSCCLYWRKQWNDAQQIRNLAAYSANGSAAVIYSIPSDCELSRQGQVLPASFTTQLRFLNENNNCASAYQNPPNYTSIYPNYQPIPGNFAASPDIIGETTIQDSSSKSIPFSDSGLYSNSSSNCSSNSSTITAILRNPNRPLTLVNIRNNYAYITSAVPLADLLKSEVDNMRTVKGSSQQVDGKLNQSNHVPDTSIAIGNSYNHNENDGQDQGATKTINP